MRVIDPAATATRPAISAPMPTRLTIRFQRGPSGCRVGRLPPPLPPPAPPAAAALPADDAPVAATPVLAQPLVGFCAAAPVVGRVDRRCGALEDLGAAPEAAVRVVGRLGGWARSVTGPP